MVSPFAQGGGTLQDVFQFPDVAGEGVVAQALQASGARRKPAESQSRRCGEDIPGEQGQVLQPLAQGSGYPQLDDVEPVEEVLAELALRRPGRQVAVGGGEDAHVHGDLPVAAHGPHGPLLDGAQQFHLHVQGQFGHLVQEQGAALGGLNRPFLVAAAPVKAPFTWPKNSLSMSSVGMAPQLTGTKGARRGALGVDQAGHQLLAAAGFALDAHRVPGCGRA
jgi:hypothetical protein